ncbi:hypothetical protein QW180_16345 [Vibrio sinaloensis]|nr:hypothetical protein [Vibrio sinaloensis]
MLTLSAYACGCRYRAWWRNDHGGRTSKT